MKFHTIVLGFDGSNNARSALLAVAEIARPETTIHLVTAFTAPSPASVAALMAEVPDEFKPVIDPLAEHRSTLDVAADFCDREGLVHTDHLVEDDPASAIIAIAEAADADLIVVGSRGVGAATRFLRGSVSSKVANHAPTSVFIVHEH